MSVKFNRVDYAQVGTTNKACLQVIRGEKDEKETKKSKKVKSGDKIVVGAQNGILLCFSRTSGDTNIAFKTPPGPPISCVRLGGALQTAQDKTFVAADAEVKGFSRKGKQFLAFQTNMTERITSMFVYGVDMFLCGRNSFYHFHDCIEKSSYVCADRITDVLCLPVTEGGWVGRGITPVLACEDKSLKVLSGNSVSCELHLTDVPNTLHLFMNDGGYNKQKVLYGTKNGTLGLADIRENDVIISWEISTKTPAGISAICCYRITGNNFPDVIIGKEDGLVEIYTVDEADEVSLRQTYQCDESITGLECGRVGSEMYDEIVICTYTGWVFALTTEPTVMPQPAEGLTPQLELKVQQLRGELEELELKVREERDRYQEMTKTQEDTLAIVPPFTVNDRFALNKELACYTLFIELVIPIDYLLLQSDVSVELMDVERNSAVVSLSTPEPSSGNALLAVYRCQADTTRMEMRIRSIEGQYGTLRVYIVPRLHPKMCQARAYPIKPLALHERVHQFDDGRPLNTLTLTGTFSLTEAHFWMTLCVSQIPERCPQQDSVTYNFQSSFGGTMLQATYTKGKAVYRSDNLSTIVILRDVISRVASARQIKIHISCETNDESIAHTLRLIHPKMEYQTNLVKHLELAKGLKDLEDSFEDTSYLSPELRSILERYDSLHDEVEKKSIYFDRLLGIITDLYIDKYKMLGQSYAKNRANDLLRLLNEDYTLENLLTFFSASP